MISLISSYDYRIVTEDSDLDTAILEVVVNHLYAEGWATMVSEPIITGGASNSDGIRTYLVEMVFDNPNGRFLRDLLQSLAKLTVALFQSHYVIVRYNVGNPHGN